MSDLSINGTTLSSLGFKLKRVDGHLAVGKPKSQGSGKDEYSSVNCFLSTYQQESPFIEIEFFGKFETIAAAESALYTLYGILIQVGEHAFIHSDDIYTIAFKGIMANGAKVTPQLVGSGLFFIVTIKITKTND